MAVQAGIYVRISQDREGAGLGVDRQEADCRALAERLGWTVGRVYRDNSISAFSGKKRPQYEALLADIEAGLIAGVVAWHPDRLHRSPKELEHYIDLSERHGVETQTVQAGRWDLSTPSGRAVARTLGAWARYESEHKGDRIKRARKQQAVTGRFHGGVRPFGFEADGMTVRPAEAAEVAKAAEAIVSGVSLRSLVRDLNERGVETVKGRPWTSQALRDILCNARTAGLSVHLGEVVGQAQWPALVPEGTWRAAVAILTDPARRTNGGKGGTVRWLGSGLYVCGICHGSQLRVSVGGSRPRHTYRCRDREPGGGTHVTREAITLDAFVEELLVARLSQPGVIDRVVAGEGGEDTSELLVEQLALKERQDELARQFAGGAITGRQLTVGTEAITARLDEIGKLMTAAGWRSPIQLLGGATDVSRLWYGEQADRSDGLPLGVRRAILDALVTVTVLPAPRGMRAFESKYVGIDWKE